jgi:hypothetical protein
MPGVGRGVPDSLPAGGGGGVPRSSAVPTAHPSRDRVWCAHIRTQCAVRPKGVRMALCQYARLAGDPIRSVAVLDGAVQLLRPAAETGEGMCSVGPEVPEGHEGPPHHDAADQAEETDQAVHRQMPGGRLLPRQPAADVGGKPREAGGERQLLHGRRAGPDVPPADHG